MSNLSKKPYKGCRDLFPEQKRFQESLFSIMKSVADTFSYQPYDGPMLEEVALYKAKSGEELINDQIYDFVDRGERHVAIRPEMTPTLARMIAQVHREIPKPIRWYTIANLMRYERPQRGRLREHWQWNCDVFGAPAGEGELELIQMVISYFQKLGASEEHFELRINDRKVVDAYFKGYMKCSDKDIHELYKIIDKSKKISSDTLDQLVGKLGLSSTQMTQFNDYLQCQSHSQLLKALEQAQVDTSALTTLTQLFEQVDQLGLSVYIKFDPCIVRGLDYYTGIVFEAFDKHPDNRRALCGGGGYENLLTIFNEPAVAGVGFGMGDVTLTDFIFSHGLDKNLNRDHFSVLLTCQNQESMTFLRKVAFQLRSQTNARVEFHPIAIKVNKAFDVAVKKQMSHLVLVGDDQKAKFQFVLKNLKTKESQNLTLDEISHSIFEGK